jgi:hypothetical protein
MSDLQSYAMQPFRIGFSLSNVIKGSFISFPCSIAHFFLMISIIPCLDLSLFTRSPTEEHLGCFPVWAIINEVAINICEQVFVWTCFQLIWVNARSMVSKSYNKHVWFHEKLPSCIPKWLHRFAFAPAMKKLLLLHIL